MKTSISKYYLLECTIAGVITVLFSLLFFYLILGDMDSIPRNTLFFDSIPQSLFGGVFAGVIPAILTRKRIMQSAISGMPLLTLPFPANPFFAGLLSALITAFVGLTLLYAGMTFFADDTITNSTALILKTGYGFLIGVSAAFLSISGMLSRHA